MRDRGWIAAVLLALVHLQPGPAALAAEAENPTPVATGGLDVYDPLFEDDEEAPSSGLDADPFEPVNRGVFAFNDGLDTWIFDPVTRAYQWAVPEPARRGVNRFFLNLNEPVVFANQLLQLRPTPAARTLLRFAANSSLGAVGFFDFAGEVMGVPHLEADFGQTLHRYGIPRGPYLVVPVIGPSTARDALGSAVDVAIDPLTYLIGPLNVQWQLIIGGSQGLALREANVDSLDALRESSVDFYAALRSAYLQSRRARELEVRPDSRASAAELGETEAFQARVCPAQDSWVPAASLAMRSSMAAINASQSSRFTIPENSERLSASSLTVPSR
jgi:phospholipid-binding lipoprotein MlaA